MLMLARTPRSKHLHLAANTGSNYENSDGEEFCPPSSKKIKPVDGLILKTPIAFQKDSDPDMIPIRKEGMAVCEKCGAIGVKHSFYTKERRFCSQACAKSFNETSHLNSSVQEKKTIMPPTSQVSSTKRGQPLEDVHVFSNKKRLQAAKEAQNPSQDKYGFDWIEMLMEPGFVTPSIACFRHAPLSETWISDISIGMKVEVENTDTRQASINGDPQSYWVASVISIMGYKARLRYEGFGDDNSKDFWVNLAAEDVHPVGWCASKGKPLIPPRTIQDKYTEWREFLVKRLTGARSLPNQYHARVLEACRSHFKVGTTLELINRNRLSTMKVATIDMILGRRLRLKYIDAQPDDAGFWCHEESNLIHPIGWAQTVGHEIDAPQDYLERCSKKAFLPTDATPDLFPELKQPTTTHKFKEGMKLEAVDPLNLDSICVATIVKVLRHGYLMIRIDRPDESDPDDSGQFCYHASSACIAPPGFCEANGITLKTPEDYEGRFRWGDYLRHTLSSPALEILFGNRELSPSQQLRVGMRVEAADLMDPRLVCVATVAQVAGRLVRIHFDGWSDDFDQWMDIASPEIYPVGWCELAGYRLEPPVVPVVPAPTVKRGRKSGRGGRGRRGARGTRGSTGAGSQQANAKRERSPSSDSPKSGTRGKAAKLGLSLSGRRSVENLRTLRPRSSQQNSDTSLDEASLDSQVDPANKTKIHPIDDEGVATDAGTNATKPSLTSSNSTPNVQKPVTQATSGGSERKIPRIIDVSAANRREALAGVEPLDWTTEDVAQFLRVNDYTAYCEAFTKELVNGRTLLNLNKDQVLRLTDMKLGPSVKILDLITQLKTRVKPSVIALRPSTTVQVTGQSSQR